jgi:iron complex transport system substrate-binding protein
MSLGKAAVRKAGLAAVLLACAASTAAVESSARAGEVVDATGARVRVADRPMRIVTLAPSLAELAAEFLDTKLDRIVGVSEYTDYPPKLAQVASVGPYSHFNVERVVSLKPDLVLGTADSDAKDQVNHLRELGVPLVVVATQNLEQIEGSMRLVGQAMGVPERGAKMAEKFKRGLEGFRAASRKRSGSRPRVLVQIGDEPLVVAGKQNFIHEALEVVGADNIYGDTEAKYPRPAIEDILNRNPDLILVLMLGNDPAPFQTMIARWKQFPAMKAVKSGRVKALQGDTIVRPTLRLLEGLSILSKAIHGPR